MTKLTPFDFLESITVSKRHLIDEADQPEAVEGQYVPYVVNKGLSFHIDSILHANQMNLNHHLSNGMQYQYYLNTISKKSRRSKWHKAVVDPDLQVVREYFQCNEKVARQYLEYLTDEQKETIKTKMLKGGTNNGKDR